MDNTGRESDATGNFRQGRAWAGLKAPWWRVDVRAENGARMIDFLATRRDP